MIVLEAVRNGAWRILPQDVEYVADIQAQKALFSRDAGIAVSALPLWHAPPSVRQVAGKNGPRTLNPVVETKYFTSAQSKNFYEYRVALGKKQYAIGFNFLASRRYTHIMVSRLMLTTFGLSASMLIALLLLFHFGVSASVRELIGKIGEALENQGAKAMKENLDEMEYLAASISSLARTADEKKRLFLENLNLKQRMSEERIRRNSFADTSVEKIKEAIAYLEQNYRFDISREGLAAQVGLSADRFGKGFKYYTGRRVGDYINELRIREALAMLEKSDKSVIDIAYATGFESLRTFNRAFFRQMKVSPSDYRESLTRVKAAGGQ